ncbi:MAG: FAD:protein FMN transferase, partial [Treponema sp.]|nr:FAD:protein FMN transferase [Treponema sp.]
MKRTALSQLLVFFIAVLVCVSCAACMRPIPSPQIEFALGTVCNVNLYENRNSKLYSRIFSRIREIDRTMSVSGLSMINQNAGIAPVQVQADLLEVLEKASHYAELSGGAFDPTIGPLVNLWGIGTMNEQVPDAAEIAEALVLVNWQDLIIDRNAGTVFLRQPGMALDLGAIAKGYAADEAARLAWEGGAKRGIFELGGDIAALGSRGIDSRGTAAPWRIGIQDPLDERGVTIGVLSVHDKCVVTSGVYERYFELEDQRYHHILSTTDGYPVDNGLLSVTILADRAIDADGLSTAVFVLGYAKGRSLLDSIPGAEAVFIFNDRSVRITNGLRESFTLTNDAY